jgi:hypothetical protein
MDWSRDKKKNRTGCTALSFGGLIVWSVCLVPIGVVDSGRSFARVVKLLAVGDTLSPTLTDNEAGDKYRIRKAHPKDEPHE